MMRCHTCHRESRTGADLGCYTQAFIPLFDRFDANVAAAVRLSNLVHLRLFCPSCCACSLLLEAAVTPSCWSRKCAVIDHVLAAQLPLEPAHALNFE